MKFNGFCMIIGSAVLLSSLTAAAYSPCVYHRDSIFHCLAQISGVEIDLEFENGTIVSRTSDPERQCPNPRAIKGGRIIVKRTDSNFEFSKFNFQESASGSIFTTQFSDSSSEFATAPSIQMVGDVATLNFVTISKDQSNPPFDIRQSVKCTRLPGGIDD